MSNMSELRTQKAAPWPWLIAELGNPDLTAVVIFCAIGLFATIAVILQSPALGAIFGQL